MPNNLESLCPSFVIFSNTFLSVLFVLYVYGYIPAIFLIFQSGIPWMFRDRRFPEQKGPALERRPVYVTFTILCEFHRT